jgi:hypothetical protein
MKRDTIKTLVGLVIIGVIVVATFLYGNAQRQAQLRHDQDIKNQQAAAAAEQAKKSQASAAPTSASTPTPAKPTPTPTPAPVSVATPTPSPKANTAPVKTPAANSIQGGQSGKVAGTSTPTTGATGGDLPQTGAPVAGMMGLSAMAVMGLAWRRSRQAIVAAARSRR